MNNRYLIAGHTDARGPDDYNVDLSYRRAWAVKRYLMRHHSIPSWRLEVVGWGERYPRNPADPYAAENRRVEITLIDRVQPVVPQPVPMPQPAPQTSDLHKQPSPQPVLPPRTGAQYVPPLPPCPAGVVSPDGKALDLDDFSPEPGIDCDPGLAGLRPRDRPARRPHHRSSLKNWRHAFPGAARNPDHIGGVPT